METGKLELVNYIDRRFGDRIIKLEIGLQQLRNEVASLRKAQPPPKKDK